MLYFAYGSNMDQRVMEKLCPDSKFVSRVYLNNYQFVYDGHSRKWDCAVADIIKLDGNMVWGSLYEITDKDLQILDRKEGYPISYQRKLFEVLDNLSKKVATIAYYREGQPIGLPSEEYRNAVISGAINCNLPTEYIEKYIRL